MYEAHWMRQLFLDFTFHLKKDIFCFHIQLIHFGGSHVGGGGGDCGDGGGSGDGSHGGDDVPPFQVLRRHFPRQETHRKPFPH